MCRSLFLGRRLHRIGGSSSSEKIRTHESRKARAQFHDGHTTH